MESKEAIERIYRYFYMSEDDNQDYYINKLDDDYQIILKDLEVLEMIRNSMVRTIKPMKVEEYKNTNSFYDYLCHQEITYKLNKLNIEEQKMLREWVINNIGLDTIKDWLNEKSRD